MNRKLWKVFAGLCAVAMSAVWALPACAQMAEVKEKPPMYSYVAYWNIPRAQWAEMAKADAADQKILDKAVSGGSIVGYGNDENRIHRLMAPHDGGGQHVRGRVLNVPTSSTRPATRRSGFEFCQTLGRPFRQPLLQLESRIVEGFVHSRSVLQVEGGRTQRCGGHAQQKLDRAADGENARRRHHSRV